MVQDFVPSTVFHCTWPLPSYHILQVKSCRFKWWSTANSSLAFNYIHCFCCTNCICHRETHDLCNGKQSGKAHAQCHQCNPGIQIQSISNTPSAVFKVIFFARKRCSLCIYFVHIYIFLLRLPHNMVSMLGNHDHSKKKYSTANMVYISQSSPNLLCRCVFSWRFLHCKRVLYISRCRICWTHEKKDKQHIHSRAKHII